MKSHKNGFSVPVVRLSAKVCVPHLYTINYISDKGTGFPQKRLVDKKLLPLFSGQF